MVLRRFGGAALIMLGIAGATSPADPILLRSAIGAGGVSESLSGNIELFASIGQPVAGSAAHGPLTLVTGFHFDLAPTDCDEDGSVSSLDYISFVECMAGPGVGTSPTCRCFDPDRSGSVDLRDFAAAQRVHNGL